MNYRLIVLLVALGATVRAAPLGEPYNLPSENIPAEDRVEIIGPLPPAYLPADTDKATVDDIRGYKSLQFGAPAEMLKPRLRPHRSGKRVEDLDPNGTYVLRQLYDGEQTYAGYPVQIKLTFLDGRAVTIELKFLTKEATAFAAAFQQKYGPPNAGANHWRGNDVDYRVDDGARGGVFVYITSLKLQREIRAMRDFNKRASAEPTKAPATNTPTKDF